MKNALYYLLLVIILSGPVVANGEQCNGAARTTLNSFLTLDANGARLKQWQAEEYLMFPNGEPGWDMAEAISSFEIVKESCDNSRCRFEVKYNFMPTSGKQFLYDHPEGDSKTEIYNLQCIKGKWLMDTTIPPHVLQDKLPKRETGGHLIMTEPICNLGFRVSACDIDIAILLAG